MEMLSCTLEAPFLQSPTFTTRSPYPTFTPPNVHPTQRSPYPTITLPIVERSPSMLGPCSASDMFTQRHIPSTQRSLSVTVPQRQVHPQRLLFPEFTMTEQCADFAD